METETGMNKQLEKFSAIVPESVIKLSDESYWVGLRTKSGSVEGKLYLPTQPNGTVLLFEPGFPGDGSARLDRLWAKGLVESGFTVFAARHNGTIINGEYSNNYLNCPKKQEKAKTDGQEILGENDDPTIADWLKEPLVALEAFASSHQEVYLAGHSFGTLATLSSIVDFVKDNPELVSRIKRFVSLAGTAGRYRGDNESPMKGWSGEVDNDVVRKKVRIGDKEANLEALKDAYLKIHAQADTFPEDMQFIFVSPWGDKSGTTDELVHPIEAVDMIVSLRKGFLILDRTQQADEASGKLAHDMDNLKPETLVRFLSKDWLPKTQISTLD